MGFLNYKQVKNASLFEQREARNTMKSISEFVLLLQFSWVAGEKKKK